MPVFDGGHWRNIACGCSGRCEITGPRVVHLPGPVQEVVEVVIGSGAALSGDEYALEGDVLYRKGGDWPCQDLGKPLGEVGTWSVTYTRGYPPPEGTAKFVGTLAAEFLKACSGEKCRLPRTVTEVVRRGVTWKVRQEIDKAGTGVPEIDMWLAAVNPNHLMQAPSVV